ncbi:hypothetical protein [Nesterenkonia populi]
MKPKLALLAAWGLVTTAAACGADDAPDSPADSPAGTTPAEDSPADTSDDSLLPVPTYEPQEDRVGMEALLEGEVREEDGCVLIDSGGELSDEEGESSRFVPSFAEDRIEPADDGLFTFEESTYEVGDEISVGGGGGITVGESDNPSIPASCPDDLSVWTVHPG